MRIDLRDCQTQVINLAKDTARRAAVAEVCERAGLDYGFLEAIQCSPGRIGCGLSHIRALLTCDLSRPLLLLEDDVALAEDFDPVISAPDDADAVYVGVSNYGAVEPVDYVGFTNMVAAEPAGDGVLRVHNMLATHAIVYLSERYRRAAVAAMVDALARLDWEPDRGLAAIQGLFHVFAVERPRFYQRSGVQPGDYGSNQEAMTRFPFQRCAVGEVVGVGLGERVEPAMLVRDGERLTWRLLGDGG